MSRLSGRLPLRELAIAALHLAVLWSFAVAQPLFDLLGDAPEFFVARENTRGDILVLALGLTLLAPLVLTGLEALAELVSSRLRGALHLVFVSLLVAAFVLQLLKDLGGSAVVLIALALGAGALAGLAYARTRAAPLLLTVLAPAPLVFLLVFLLLSPVSKLVLPGSDPQTADVTIPGATPVVMIVFDELAGYALMDADGRVNAARYPNFARLADDSTWYRNATAVADFTDRALPALLTGDTPDPTAAPIAADHPDSLFTLLGGRYSFDVSEPVTDVCPHALCPAEAADAGSRRERLRELTDDLSLVSLHLLLPEDLSNDLAPVDRSFGDFGGEESAGEEAAAASPASGAGGRALEALASITERIAIFTDFERRLRSAKAEAHLSFLHLQMPHNPYHFLPNGQRYPDLVGLPGLDQEAGRAGGIWARDRWLTEQALQRYLLQVEYTDLLLGRVLDRLRAAGVYERALVVVLADHGASFRAGEPHRAATAGNLPDIAGIPLFVKAPGQPRGRVSDANVSVTDLLPTVAARLGVRLPWDTDGRPADRAPADGTVNLQPSEEDGELSLAFTEFVRRRDALVRRIATRFGRTPSALWDGGPEADLVGRRVNDLAPRESAKTRFSLDAGALLTSVQPGAARVPALISGRISGLEGRRALAVALDGEVAATTMPYRDGEAWRFAALVPPQALAEGANSVDLIAVTAAGAGRSFERLRGVAPVTYRLTQEGDRQVIVDPSGREIPVGPSALTGYVDQLSIGDTQVSMRGWAGDTERPQAAERVVAFAGESYIGSATPSVAREDLGDKFGQELSHAGFELSGFTAGVKPGSAAAPVQVYAILDGRASPVPQPEAP